MLNFDLSMRAEYADWPDSAGQRRTVRRVSPGKLWKIGDPPLTILLNRCIYRPPEEPWQVARRSWAGVREMPDASAFPVSLPQSKSDPVEALCPV
jgi:hypothetical protein